MACAMEGATLFICLNARKGTPALGKCCTFKKLKRARLKCLIAIGIDLMAILFAPNLWSNFMFDAFKLFCYACNKNSWWWSRLLKYRHTT